MNAAKSTKLCRICLNPVLKKYMSVFEKYKDISVNDYILLLTNVEIKKDDGFPDKICSECFLELEAAIKFKHKCEESDVILKASKDKLLEVCEDKDLKDVIIVKKEEPYEAEIKFESITDDDNSQEDQDDYYAVEVLEEESVNNVKPFKSKAIDLKLECHDCGNLFKSKCKLRVHWKKVHMLSSLICEICKRRFKSYKAYHLHKKRNTKSCRAAANSFVRVEGEGRHRVFHCKECQYKTSRVKDIETHVVIHSGDRPYQCTICPSRYTQQSSLQGHMEAAHGKLFIEITCHFCGKYVKGRSKVYRHMRSHTEEKVQCPVCQKNISKRNLKYHLQRHTGCKTYTCEKCASPFYTAAELCNHRRSVHNRIYGQYKCDLCAYVANRKERIKIHMKNHMLDKIPCVICGMFFPTEKKLQLHKRRHLEEKKHECQYCEKKFHRRDSINKHIKSKHKNILLCTKERIIPDIPVNCKEEELESNELKITTMSTMPKKDKLK